MENFVAIDFETANDNPYSACSVGIAKFENGVLVDTFYNLINPQQKFEYLHHIEVHGIRPKDVKTAPTYPEIYPKIREYLDGNLVVAHNGTLVENRILQASSEYYDLEPVTINFLDTLTLCRTILPGMKHRFKDMVKYYSISEITNFHNALEDAKGCGLLLLALLKDTNSSTILGMMNKYGYKDFGKLSLETYTPFSRSGKSKKNYQSVEYVGIDELVSEANIHKVDVDTVVLNGKNIVFTGKLLDCERKVAANIASGLGANVQKGITKATDILVIGLERTVDLGSDGKTSKVRKAEKMISQGHNLAIVDEKKFWQLVSNSKRSNN